MGSKGQSDRYVALDSWRGICALAVAIFHFPVLGVVRSSPVIAHSFLFVDFFFVLSGFVIAKAYEARLADEDEGWRFIVRRFGRLWPLHVAMLGLFVLSSLAKGDLGSDERHSVWAIFTNLTLVHGLGLHHDLTWNGPSWSISVEAVMYLLFALFAPMPRRHIVFMGLIVIGLLVLAFQAPHGMSSTFDYGVFRGLAGFFTGVLVARLPAIRAGTLAELACVAMVVLFVAERRLTVLAPFVFGAAVVVFANSNGKISDLLKTRAPVALGTWSYSIYMTHAAIVAVIWAAKGHLSLTQVRGELIAPSVAVELGMVAAYLAVIVGVSFVTYKLIEEPARGFFNRAASYRTMPVTA